MFFWFCLLCLSLICYAACANQTRLVNETNGILREKVKFNKYIVFIFAFILIFFAGMRSGIGDTGYYMYGFSEYKKYSIMDFFNLNMEKEPGFKFLMIFISSFTKNEQVFIFLMAIVTIGLTILAIYKYSEDIGMSLFLFLTTGVYLGMLNGIRQYIVVAVLFLATNLIIENKPIKYSLIVILLSTIHTSALIMLPIFFFSRRKVWSFSNFLFIGIFTVFVLTFSNWVQGFVSIFQDTVYGKYSNTLLNETDVGTNILRILVMFVPVLLSFLGRKAVDQNDIYYRVYSNILILNFLIYLLSSYNWIFARISMYLNIYTLLFYPYILKRIFDKKSLKIAKVIMILAYSVFFVFEIRNVDYISYYLNINRERIGILTRGFY